MSAAPPLALRDQISAAIAAKAWKDEAFHRAVLEDANKAIEQYTGQPLPAGLTVTVVEDTPTQVHLVLPVRPQSAGALQDAELETVAGGVYADPFSYNANPFMELLSRFKGGW